MKTSITSHLFLFAALLLGLSVGWAAAGPYQLTASRLFGGGCEWECDSVGPGPCSEVEGMPAGCSGSMTVCNGYYNAEEEQDCTYDDLSNQDCAGTDPDCQDWAIPLSCP